MSPVSSARRRAPRSPIVLVSNREPFEHQFAPDGSIAISRPAGGLVSALLPVLERSGGAWIAWGSGDADFAVTNASGVVALPPGHPTFDLHRLRLGAAEIQGYYSETANRALW
ncbi:MAG: alpha,alpha-trehalose-phosphate synthase (UDP-forming), partial [Gemmatimonadales bacterium]